MRPVGGPDEVHLQAGILLGKVDTVVCAARLATLARTLERGPRGQERALQVEGVGEVVVAGDVGPHLQVARSRGDLVEAR